jgi:hypothetical protein
MNHGILQYLIIPLILCATTQHVSGGQCVVITPRVGETIDAAERDYFRLFPQTDDFQSATFSALADGRILLTITEESPSVKGKSGYDSLTLVELARRSPVYQEILDHWNDTCGAVTTDTLDANTFAELGEYIENFENVVTGRSACDTAQIGRWIMPPSPGRRLGLSAWAAVDHRASSDSTYLSVGIGSGKHGVPGNLHLTAVRIALSFSEGKHRFTLSYTNVSIWKLGINLFGGKCHPSPQCSYDAGLLYGWQILKGSWGFLQAGAGLAFTRTLVCRNHPDYNHPYRSYTESKRKSTIGLPLNLQAVFPRGSHPGLECDFFCNLNPLNSFYGLTVGLWIGAGAFHK